MTITRVFEQRSAAEAAIQALEANGFTHDELSLVLPEIHSDPTVADKQHAGEGAVTGATIGTALGGGAGLLAGLGLIAIPGIGPLVAAGWALAALTGAGAGALAGGLMGRLTGAGLTHADAELHADALHRGHAVIAVRTEDPARSALATEILDRFDVTILGEDYRAAGNTGDARVAL